MRRPSLGAIFLTILIDLLGFGLVMPFLAEEARDTFHTNALVGTLLGSVYSLMQFVFVPVWGRLSDRIGRKPVIVWSVFASALAMSGLGLAIAYAPGKPIAVLWLFVARAFSGIATANIGTASAYIADVTAPKDRAKGMGLIGIAFGLGFIFGPALGGWLAPITIHGRQGALACFVAAGLSAINFVWVLLGVPESLSPERRAKIPARSLSPLNLHAAREAFAIPGLGRVILVNFLIVLAFTNLDQTFRMYNADLFGMTSRETGFVLAFIGITAAGVQGGLIRRLSQRYSEAAIIRAGALFQAAGFLCLATVPATPLGRVALYAGGGLLALGNGLTQPSVSAFVSKRAGPSVQGATLGTNQSIASLARVFGPAMGGVLYTSVGVRAPYAAGFVGMLLAFLFAMRVPSETPAASEP